MTAEMLKTADSLPMPVIDPEVQALAETIDIGSPLTVQQFGKQIAERSAAYADEILAAARSTDLDETGAQLTQIVVAAQEFNLDNIGNALTRAPIVGGFLKKLAMTRERAVARFDSVKGQVDKLVQRVDATAGLLERRNTDYQAMYDGVKAEYASLGKHVQAIELRLTDVDHAMAQLGGADDLESGEKLAMLEGVRQQMQKRADDMRVLQHAAMQTLPMIRIIQSNNLTLVDKFQNIRQLTLPAWKRTFMLALTLDEQKSAVELASSIDDATNAMMRRNAELLHQNSVATAKSNQRLVIDVETLREVHDKILLTLTDVRKAHEEGGAKRREALGELDRLRVEMASTVKAIAHANA